jgi:hypothetical protein
MSDFTLVLNTEERQFLTDLLDHALKEKRVEERRTSFNTFRDIVVQQEQVLQSVLDKLGHAATV